MKLLIVESPTKAKTLTRYLKDFKVIASVGHVIDLPTNELGVDVEHEFKPRYVTIKGKEKIIKQISEEAAKADEIYIGSDPDREGEAIAFHIASLFDKPVRRVLFHEITKSGAIKALDNYVELNESLYNAQQARRILDRIVGYKLSPFLWRSVKKGLSAGRVQSVALQILVNRERAIRAFVPEEYWTFKAKFAAADTLIEANLEKVDGKKLKVGTEDVATEIEKRIKTAASYHVASVEKKKKQESPLPPFTTSLLQQEGSRRYHYTAEKIMRIAQSLYEGKEIGSEGPTGLITYMRTDSFRISEEANASLRTFIQKTYGETYLHDSIRGFKNKKGKVQDAHEAIRPTDVTLTPDRVKSHLSREEHNIYTLIWKRFVATQMEKAIIGQTTILIEDNNNGLQFKKTGSVVEFDGYRKVYDRQSKDELLPPLNQNDPMNLTAVSADQNFTKPPSRFSEGTLVKELEDKGVGRPSTYAAIIKQIVMRKYIARLKEPRGALAATELGELVSDTLQQFFPDIINVGFTADMEENLDKIEEGQIDYTALLESFFNQLMGKLDESFAELKKEGKKKIYAEEKCPECGKNLVVRWSKKGNEPFLSCEGYPDCTFAGSFERDGEKIHLKIIEREPEKLLDEKCPKCGSPLVIKHGRYGEFKACSAYPECKTIIREEIKLCSCPKEGCEGDVVQKRSRRGKLFYGCNKYPDCDFVSWYPPVEGETCPKCGANYIVEKKRGKSCQICGAKIE